MGENDELNVQKVIREIVEKDGPALARKWGEELRADRAKVREATDQAEVDTEVITKKCTKCGEEKALDSFSNNRSRKDGKCHICKTCTREYQRMNREKIAVRKRKYYEENKERVNEYARKYRIENKERVAGYERKYRIENKQQIAERSRKFYQENKKRINERKRKYRLENSEKISVSNRKYWFKNSEKMADRWSEYYKQNKVHLMDYQRSYRKENPEVHRRSSRKRRALKRSLPHAPLTPAQYERLYEFRDQVFDEVTS